MSVNKNIFYTFLTQVPTIILSVLSGVFTTRILSAKGSGVFTLFQTDHELFTLFLGFSLNSALVYFISTKKIDLRKLYGISISLILIGIAMLLLIFPLSDFLEARFNFYLFPNNYSSWQYKGYLLLLFVFSSVNSSIAAYFQGYGSFRIINIISITNSILNCLLYGIAFFCKFYLKFNIYVNEVLLISAIIMAINTCIYIYAFMKHTDVSPSFQFDFKTDIKPLFNFVTIGHASHMINFLNYSLDIWIIQYYCNDEQLGYYSKAVGVTKLFWLISTPIVNVLSPYLSNPDSKDKESLFKYYSKLNFTIVLVCSLLLGLLAVPFFTLLFGQEFIASVGSFWLLLPGLIAVSISKVFSIYVYSSGKFAYNLLATVFGVITTLTLDFLLIPAYGIKGAAIASSTAYIVVLIIVCITLLKVVKLSPGNYFFLNFNEIKQLTHNFFPNAKRNK